MTVQFIEIDGQKLAIMPINDYEHLVAEAEGHAEIRAAIAAEMRRDAGEEYLPAAMVDRLLAGEAPLRVWREYRGMTLEELSKASGLSVGYISQLERGIRQGPRATFGKLAKALNVDAGDLEPGGDSRT